MNGEAAPSDDNVGAQSVREAQLLHKRDDEVLDKRHALRLLEDLHAHGNDGAAQVSPAEAVGNGRGRV